MIKRIIDKRIKEKFMMDDAYLNGQAKICGWQSTLVYNSLCRHTNINQESFPSIRLMAEELGVSRETIMKGIENLEKNNVIQVKKNRTRGGQWLNNTYTLIDKSEWIKHQVANTDLVGQVDDNGIPSSSQPPDQVANTDIKETHKQGNTYKETHIVAKSDTPFSLQEEIKKLEDSTRRDLNIVALYFEHRKPDLQNLEQYEKALKRHLRSAGELKVFSDEQILKALEKAQKEYPDKFTLETLMKILTK